MPRQQNTSQGDNDLEKCSIGTSGWTRTRCPVRALVSRLQHPEKPECPAAPPLAGATLTVTAIDQGHMRYGTKKPMVLLGKSGPVITSTSNLAPPVLPTFIPLTSILYQPISVLAFQCVASSKGASNLVAMCLQPLPLPPPNDLFYGSRTQSTHHGCTCIQCRIRMYEQSPMVRMKFR